MSRSFQQSQPINEPEEVYQILAASLTSQLQQITGTNPLDTNLHLRDNLGEISELYVGIRLGTTPSRADYARKLTDLRKDTVAMLIPYAGDRKAADGLLSGALASAKHYIDDRYGEGFIYNELEKIELAEGVADRLEQESKRSAELRWLFKPENEALVEAMLIEDGGLLDTLLKKRLNHTDFQGDAGTEKADAAKLTAIASLVEGQHKGEKAASLLVRKIEEAISPVLKKIYGEGISL